MAKKKKEAVKIVEDNKPQTTLQKFAVGTRVIINGILYTSSNASSPAGNVSNKITYITRFAPETKHPYNTSGDLGWMDESSISIYNGVTYTVKKGDALSDIASKYGMSWQELYAKNKFIIGNNPNAIKPGQVLTIK